MRYASNVATITYGSTPVTIEEDGGFGGDRCDLETHAFFMCGEKSG
jgi:hypothetical protein